MAIATMTQPQQTAETCARKPIASRLEKTSHNRAQNKKKQTGERGCSSIRSCPPALFCAAPPTNNATWQDQRAFGVALPHNTTATPVPTAIIASIVSIASIIPTASTASIDKDTQAQTQDQSGTRASASNTASNTASTTMAQRTTMAANMMTRMPSMLLLACLLMMSPHSISATPSTLSTPTNTATEGNRQLSESMAPSATSGILRTLPQIEELRRTTLDSATRVENLNIVSESDLKQQQQLDQSEPFDEIAICQITDLNRHSLIAGGTQIAFPVPFPLQVIAAMSLAMEHLNTGNGRIVPQVEGLNQRCNVRFTSQFLDTVGSESEGVNEVIDVLDESKRPTTYPCAFTGAFRSAVSVATAIITGVKGYPHFSGVSNAEQLSDKDTFPLFGRVIPTNSLFGRPLLDYLHNTLNARNLCVIYTDNTNGLSYFDGIRAVANDVYPDTNIESVAYNANTNTDWAEPIIEEAKRTEVRYFFVIASSGEHEPLMREAYRQGIAGTGEHVWIFSNEQAAAKELGQPKSRDDELQKASKGALSFATIGSLPGVGKYDEFEKAWKELNNPIDNFYLHTKIPTHPDAPAYQPQFDSSVFDMGLFPFTPLFYDATIAIGLGACAKQLENANSDALNTTYQSGADHYASTLATSFNGAGGALSFDASTGNREPTSSLFVLGNFVEEEEMGGDDGDKPTGNVTLGVRRIAYFDAGAWTQQNEIIFNDGTGDIPLDLPQLTVDKHYIAAGLRIGGYLMAGIIIASSIGLMIWTQLNRTIRTIRASQPIFLHLIAFGTILMASSIIPLSFDEEIASTASCDMACESFPWLLALGWCIAISALFTKTHRVNRIFHNPDFRRVTVTVMDVLPPMALCLTINVIILVVWSTVAPLRWSRSALEFDTFGRLSESRGQCKSEHSLIFIVLLAIVNFGVLIYAIYEAYIARKISTEFAESEYIARAMSIICMVGFLGIPLVYIAEGDSESFFFVLAAIIFIACMALLFFIFVPKITFYLAEKKKKEKKQRMSQHFQANQHQQYSNASGLSHRVDHTGALTSTYPASMQSTSESSEVGAAVVEHPKLKEETDAQAKTLKRQQRTLRQRIEDLESLYACIPTTEFQERFQRIQQKYEGLQTVESGSSRGSSKGSDDIESARD